ncbi:MAG: SDR family NAD(P)-dependent oxidoreductase [Nitrososphaerales archaeon]
MPALLEGKNALVTGAGKGIGRAIGLSLAENGANVCLSSRSLEDIETLSRDIVSSSLVKAFPLTADVSKKTDAKNLVHSALAKMGSIDILVCAAGFPLIGKVWEQSLHELDEDDFLSVFQVDVLGSFRMAKYTLPVMMKQKSGVIILFSSTPAIRGYNEGAPYTVAKAANLGLVKEIASEYGKYNIRAYAVAPGNIRTEKTFDRLSAKEKKLLAGEAPMKRWGEPREVASVVCALASENMSFVTGQTIVVDGGTVML